MISGKKIILGVCASISAYKAAYLIRLLVKRGAEVQVIMTGDATAFITPLTLSTLSKREVLSRYFDDQTGNWNNHIELALWADVLLIAPASADTLAKMAAGICDNLLLAVYLSAKCPVMFAPAMDLDMWKHPATQANINRLRSYGHFLIAPENGELASGLSGEGRLAGPENIVERLHAFFTTEKALAGKKALVTAGPTYEAIDPVRFIGNHSSGKMGFALAEALQRRGAEVTLVSGPVSLKVEEPGIKKIDVLSAQEMHEACMQVFAQQDIVIMAAAVADYRPAEPAREKIKKNDDKISISLTRNPDILGEMGRQKEHQVLLGFALETTDEKRHALEKLHKKNLDFIALNSLRHSGAGFGTETNRVTLFDKAGGETSIGLQSKRDVAAAIVQQLTAYLSQQPQTEKSV